MESGNYRLKVPVTSLESLAGAITDLQIVAEMLEHCCGDDAQGSGASIDFEEACWTTAIVRYERCFSGRSWAAKEIVTDRLSRAQFEAHNYFRYLRDKMFSHALGVGEDFEITAAVYPGPSRKLEIVGVGPRPRRISSPGQDLAWEFMELVVVVRDLVEPAYEAQKAKLLSELRTVPIQAAVKGRPLKKTDLPWGKDQPDFRKYLENAAKRSGTFRNQ